MDSQSFAPLPVAEMMRPVTRVVYASVAHVQGSVYSEMERIRASAVRHNTPVGVHTALLYQSGWFVQWKEGPRDAVDRLMDRLTGDKRHHDMRIVHSSTGPRLLDGAWSMAIVQCCDPPEDMARRVEHISHHAERGRQYAPPTVWRRLSTPMRHPGAANQADPDAFQRVLVCCATGMVSFDLVAWLAKTHHQEVVHRRFAGAQQLDVGTDYVDFEEDDRVLRVIAMARRGLEVPLTRAFLPDYSHVVVLLCGDRQRDLALVHRVAEACARLPSPPALLGVAPTPDAHRGAFAAAHSIGLIYLEVLAPSDDPQRIWRALHPQLAVWRQMSSHASQPSQVPLASLSVAPAQRAAAAGRA